MRNGRSVIVIFSPPGQQFLINKMETGNNGVGCINSSALNILVFLKLVSKISSAKPARDSNYDSIY
jgi:hypothetical protein